MARKLISPQHIRLFGLICSTLLALALPPEQHGAIWAGACILFSSSWVIERLDALREPPPPSEDT